MSATLNLLRSRQQTHGDFAAVARLYEALLTPLRAHPNWKLLPVRRRVALEMIALKQARILCGDHAHLDHWRDIAGYAEQGADFDFVATQGEAPA